MRKSRKSVLLAGFIVLALPCFAQVPRQVKVIIDNANIRSKPELNAELLDIASKGALFEVIEKAGDWYAIKLGEDQGGRAVYGYIHESMVERIGVTGLQPQAVREPEPVPPPPPPVPEPAPPPQEIYATQATTRPREKLISGSFIKYGFGEHWLVSFGADLGIGRHLGIGLEFQPYYNHSSEFDRSVLQMDVYVNAKLGFKLGLFTFYGGGGLGPDLSYVNTEIGGQSFTKLEAMLAYHGILGLALNIGKIGLVFEFQPIMVSDPNLDPDTWGQFFFIGLRF